MTVQERLPPPLAPQNVRLDRTGAVWRSDRFRVNWDRVPNPKVWTTYKLELRYHRAFGGTRVWESPVATRDLSAVYEGPVLPQEGTFQVVVVAIDPLGQRTESAPLDVVAINPPPPPRPVISGYVPHVSLVDGSAILFWERMQQPGVWTTYKMRVHYHTSFGYGLIWQSTEPLTTTFDVYPGPFPQEGTFSAVVVAEDSFGQRTESLPVDLHVVR